MNKNKAIDKAKKLKALADRGIGGEKLNAKAQLDKLMKEHNLSDTDVDTETETYEVTAGWHIQTEKRKFADNEMVLVHGRERMIVEKAYVTLKGWRYVARFINKDGTMNKRTCAWGTLRKKHSKIKSKIIIYMNESDIKTE